MIHIFGAEGTSEYEAALALHDNILECWPELENDTENRITIVTGVQCHGQKTRDIDLVLLANFETGISHEPLFPFQSGSKQVHPNTVLIESLCVVIEVKEHSVGGVLFRGTTVEVAYGNKWHNASEQNESQKYAFRNYLNIHRITSPFITSLIWLRNIPNASLPQRPHNILGGNSTWDMFVSVIIQMSPPHYDEGQWRLSAHQLNHVGIKQVADLLTVTVHPSQLDRRRMEQISQRIILEQQNLPNIVGKNLLLLRGRGGTGKTIRLLQLAKYFYEREFARVLILTYNKALVADLRRLLTIMGIADYTVPSGIQVQTVHSFFYAALRGLGVLTASEDNFLEGYADYKREVIELLKAEVLTQTDIDRLKEQDKLTFAWDHIYIDEGQDWPQDEQEILFSLYPPHLFVIADGIDQLIRSAVPATWHLTVEKSQRRVKHLKRCLRMKAGLTRFVSSFAEQLGLPQSEWVANEEVPGGRVVILEGNGCLSKRELFEDLIARNKAAGNQAVDMLYCVPPNMVHMLSESEMESFPASVFQDWGWLVWDGASPITRNTYPTKLEQLRIAQYDSCRGLEGWTVVNFELDSFYDYKLRQSESAVNRQAVQVSFTEEEARLRAARWLMIPLTRAMDTLVIHIKQSHSTVRDALEVAAQKHADFIEWYRF